MHNGSQMFLVTPPIDGGEPATCPATASTIGFAVTGPEQAARMA